MMDLSWAAFAATLVAYWTPEDAPRQRWGWYVLSNGLWLSYALWLGSAALATMSAVLLVSSVSRFRRTNSAKAES